MKINKILFFGHYPNSVEVNLNVFYRNLIYQFADMGIECTVIDPVSITKYKGRVREIPIERVEHTENGATVRVISPRYISFSSKKIGKIDTHVWTVKAYRKAAIKQVKKYKLEFDATYGHFINMGGIPACKIGHLYGVPAFVANGESDLNPSTYTYKSKYDLAAFKYCKGVISVSTKNKNELIALKLIDENIIKVFPNAVDHTVFFPRDRKKAREELGIQNDVIVGGFVGGFSERKGDKRVLKAAENIDNLKLAFAGDGAVKPEGQNVVFCKPLEHSIVPVFLSACDFFVLPTLNEGCCNAVVEAMACGLPVISSDLEFNDDILDNSNSIRIDPKSIAQLNEGMQKLTNNELLRQKLARGALEKANQLRIENRARNILAFMNQLGSEDINNAN